MTDNTTWDREADVVVLGSGGAALTAAIAAHDFGATDVVILEKSGMVGGTTAMSGGMLWIPNNHHQQAAGIAESDEDIVAYLDALSPGTLDPETLGAFMEFGPEMVRYLEDRTPVRFHAFADFPDYQPYMPGAKPTAVVRSTMMPSRSSGSANGRAGSIRPRWPIRCAAA